MIRSAMLLLLSGCLLAAEPIMHEVISDGHPIVLWEKRPEQPKSAMLLVHGRTWSALPNFDLDVPGEDLSLMDALVDLGYAVYAVDMRGYGATKRDQSTWLSPKKAAQDIINILAWIGQNSQLGPKTAVMGWSFGSTVSQLAAQQAPDHFSHLILYGYWFKPSQKIPERPDPEEQERRVNTRAHAAEDFIVLGSISQKAIDAYVDAALKADPVRVDVRRAHEFNALDAAKVTVPTLLLEGEHDPLTDDQAHAQVFTQLGHPHKSWVVLSGGDHAAHLEKTMGNFVSALDNFIQR